MKYVEILLLMICLNISFSFVDMMGLVPMSPHYNDTFTTGGSVSVGELTDTYAVNKSDSISALTMSGIEEAKYSKGVLANSFQDVDFLTGTWIMIEILGQGLFYLGTTLNALGVPGQLHFMFIIPMYIMYLIALFQTISGRNIEGNK